LPLLFGVMVLNR